MYRIWRIYMKKKILLLGMMLLLLTACSLSKKAITKDDFVKKAEDNKLIVVDVLEQFAEKEEMESATVAASPENWQVEFYVLATKKDAKDMFKKNKDDFEGSYSVKKVTVNLSGTNYDKFTMDASDMYFVLTRVDNTLLYVKAPSNAKEPINEFIKELGY